MPWGHIEDNGKPRQAPACAAITASLAGSGVFLLQVIADQEELRALVLQEQAPGLQLGYSALEELRDASSLAKPNLTLLKAVYCREYETPMLDSSRSTICHICGASFARSGFRE